MANPIRYDWLARNTSYFVAAKNPIAGVPLVWNNTVTLNNIIYQVSGPVTTHPTTGLVNPIALMPPNNVRTVSLTSAADLSAINFTLWAMAETGYIYPIATITGPNANTVYFTAPAYKLFSIIPDTTNLFDTVSVGFGEGGNTVPFQCDVWNQNSFLTFQISRITAATGAVSISPQGTLDPDVINTPGGPVPQIPVTGTTNTPAPAPNQQVWLVLTPDSTNGGSAVPTAINRWWTLREFPLSSVRFVQPQASPSTLVGSFTVTIMQQGGHY